jgi:RNA polymerase sigma-70 factor (ECF subfamily)
MAADQSFTMLLERVRCRDDEAARVVFQRFSQRLFRLAGDQLDSWVRQKADAEDVVQSVYRTVFARLAEGQYELADWNGLWGLLTLITVRKCINRAEHFQAARRDGRRELSLSAPHHQPLELVDREPTPLEVATLSDLTSSLLAGLDDRDQTIFLLTLDGHSIPDISARVGRSERTVHRKLDNLRRRLLRLHDGDMVLEKDREP